jgi:hypothetical protein
MQMLMLPIICSCDLCQETGNHFDDVFNWHATNLVLRTLITNFIAIFWKGIHVVAICQGLNVFQVADLDAPR